MRGGKRKGAGRPRGTIKEKKINYHRRVKPEWIPLLDNELYRLKLRDKYKENEEQ